ncbi:MAG: alpha/beta fold hydrolase [Deltaproteobacteria bacterium]|nr:MAG: alpha/beta fold hydrolase [Deltaproteobacteria bacterium]
MARERPTRHHAETRDGWRISLYHHPPRGGERGLPIVLCHGMGSNRYNMDGPGRTSLARFLNGRGHDVWVLELRGAGRSRRLLRVAAAPYRWTFEDYVQHDVPAALSLVRQLSGCDQVLWVGHSLGGMVAYATLMTPAGESIAGLVTLASPGMTDVGHEALDRWLRMRTALRLAPNRLPTRALARLGAPLARTISFTIPTLVRDWFWHPDNFDARVVRFMMCRGVEDLPRSLLYEFAEWYETRSMSDRYNLFIFADHLERIRVPIFVIAGSRDRLTPPPDLERLLARVGSDDKTFLLAGHAGGLDHEYSHVDLVLSHHAADEIFPRVADWLEARMSKILEQQDSV